MCGKNCLRGFILALFLLAFSSESWSQSAPDTPSWVDSEMYSVPGSTLNGLQADLLTASEQLTLSASQLETLKSQLATVSKDFAQFRVDVADTEFVIAVGGVALGFLGGVVTVLVLHR